ncbi:MAG TPA: hypothetical protein VF753_09990 [Terriglobales bacterium]
MSRMNKKKPNNTKQNVGEHAWRPLRFYTDYSDSGDNQEQLQRRNAHSTSAGLIPKPGPEN